MEGLTYTVLLVGQEGSGRTAFVQRHLTGDFYPSKRELNWPVTLRFHTDHGYICFRMIRTPTSGYNGHFDAVFFFHTPGEAVPLVGANLTDHCTNRHTKLRVDLWSRCDLTTDAQKKQLCNLAYSVSQTVNTICWEISSRSNYNFEKPFLHLAKKLANASMVV